MNYYIYVNKEQQGPYTIDELRTRHIASDTLVWHEGMEQWIPAWQVDDLKSLFEPTQPTPPPVATAPQQQQQPAHPRKTSGCAKALFALLVLVALAMFLLASTCPSRQDHQEAVKAEVSRLIDKATQDTDNDLFGSFGKLFTSSIAGLAIDNMLDVHNYVLWSVGEVHYGGHTKKVSFGILNHVFTFDADDLEKAMKEGNSIKEAIEDTTPTTSESSATDEEPADTIR